MSRRTCSALGAILLAAATAGCGRPPLLQAVTTPPPLAQASLVDDGGDARITVTKGVALAFTCTNPVTDEPCNGVSATMADPSIASVTDGYLDALSPAYQDPIAGIDGAQPQSALVVVGLEPGQTTLHFSWAPPDMWTSGDDFIPVTVLDP